MYCVVRLQPHNGRVKLEISTLLIMNLFLVCNDPRFEELVERTGSREISVDPAMCTSLYQLIKEICQRFIPLDEIERYLASTHKSEARICFSLNDRDCTLIGPNVVYGKMQTTELEHVGAGRSGIKEKYTYSDIADIQLGNLIENVASVSLGFLSPGEESYQQEAIVKYGDEWWDYLEISGAYISLRPSDETDICPSDDFLASEDFMNEAVRLTYSCGEIETFVANMKTLSDKVKSGFCDLKWLVCEYEHSRIDLRIYPDKVLCRVHEDVVPDDDVDEDEDDF